MSRLLKPGQNDNDFLEILTLKRPQASLTKKFGHKRDTTVKVGETVQGELSDVLKKGAIVKIIDPANPSHNLRETTTIEKIDASDIEHLQLQTKNSLYELNILGRDYLKASLLYLKRGYLDSNDKMPDKFMDGGREMSFQLDDRGELTPQSYREIIYVDQNTDLLLQAKFYKAQEILKNISDPKQRAITLALYVASISGGNQLTDLSGTPRISDLCYTDIQNFYKTYPENGKRNTLPIGYLNYGVCRHRSILFKYFADRLGIRSRLIRGKTHSGHVWNIVEIEGKYYLIDVMKNPFELVPITDHENIKKYQRMDGRGRIVGGVGAKSIENKNNR